VWYVPAMSRFRLIPLCLLAALALSGVVMAPAGAEEPKKCGVESPTYWAFCYGSNNEEIGNPIQDVSGTSSKAVLAATISAAEAKFECKEVRFAAELKPEGKGGGAVTLLKCKETKPEYCKLTAEEEREITLHFSESLIGKIEKPGKPEAQLTGTGSGEEVGILYVEHETSECSIVSGGYRVTGKQDIELPHAEESLSEHELVARKSGSYLKIGENEASLSSTLKVKLTTTHEDAAWYVGLGG
jgi:hypothetical protein